ncbi:hypothetical protein [Alienimonas californiensis]|uniref:Secreted protein n=1 Tax=Alienimonas californiensis TaxID=2527989 RepID=A0A517PEB0_9PLAN|nr:hypothetical protein [Alienimonas californiensis]QDT17713.1 hypothetical protein CA12_38440 [Alienimonas californiensis]
MSLRLTLVAATAAATLCFVPSADAAPPSIHRRAVDRLTVALPDGGEAELHGVFAGTVEAAAGGEAVKNPADAVRFAVRRDDVDLDHPGLVAKWEQAPAAPAAEKPKQAPASDDPVAIAEQLRDRLVPWMERRVGEPSLSLFLEGEFERVSDLLADADEGRPIADGDAEPEPAEPASEPSVRRPRGPWAVLAVPRSAVQEMHRTAPHRRRLALHAWDAGLRNVALRETNELEGELRERGGDVRSVPAAPWTGDRPVTAEPAETPFVAKLQSEHEWAARVAIVESAMRDEFSFQGTGSTLMKTPQAGEAVNGQALMMQMAGGQYRDLIDELTQPNAFSQRAQRERQQNRNQTAIEAAERAGRSGVRVTRVAMDAAAQRATVESEFLAKDADGNWGPIWSAREVRGFEEADADTVDRIRQDPQVEGLLNGGGALGGLGGLLGGGLGGGGLGGAGGRGLLEMAVQGGAATKSALDAVNVRWERFRTPYLERLDGPPLPLPGG